MADPRERLVWALTQRFEAAELEEYYVWAAGGPVPRAEVVRERTSRRNITEAVRAEVFAADPICRYCDVRPTTTVDHVVPIAAGGTSDRDNLVGACWLCNVMKGAQPLTDGLRAVLREHGRMWRLGRDYVDARGIKSAAMEDVLAGRL